MSIDLKQALKDYRKIKSLGGSVPKELAQALDHLDRTQRGVVEVYECTKCSVQIETFVRIQDALCRCGKYLKRTWQQSG